MKLWQKIDIENAGYLALRELCNRGNVPVELLLGLFEQKIIDRILKLYPADTIATKASVILASSDESLPLDFINRLPNPLEDMDFTQLIETMR